MLFLILFYSISPKSQRWQLAAVDDGLRYFIVGTWRNVCTSGMKGRTEDRG